MFFFFGHRYLFWLKPVVPSGPFGSRKIVTVFSFCSCFKLSTCLTSLMGLFAVKSAEELFVSSRASDEPSILSRASLYSASRCCRVFWGPLLPLFLLPRSWSACRFSIFTCGVYCVLFPSSTNTAGEGVLSSTAIFSVTLMPSSCLVNTCKANNQQFKLWKSEKFWNRKTPVIIFLSFNNVHASLMGLNNIG